MLERKEITAEHFVLGGSTVKNLQVAAKVANQ